MLKRGAPFAYLVKLEEFETLGFKAKLAFTHDRHYPISTQPDVVFCA